MTGHKLLLLVLTACSVATNVRAQQAAVIDDPDGYVNVREGKSAKSLVVATVKAGEPFTFTKEDSEWGKVALASGKTGWMHLSRVRLYFTRQDLPSENKDPAGLSEIDQSAQAHGFDYASGTGKAARGDAKALQKFFELARDADGAAAESISGMPTVVYHLVGDEKFAKFLSAQALPFRMMVRDHILTDGLPLPAPEYLSRHFPLTSKLLFQREMLGWFSPNDQYAIRKVFTDALDLKGSKVERAELIEKKSGRVLCDLTREDIGLGAEREGEALWSPDSKRVACLSSDLTEQSGDLFGTPRPAPLRKTTAVYQLAGDSFARVDLALDQAPGSESDKELDGAVPGHIYTEPVRWQKPNLLVLNRHEYYRVMKPTTIGGQTFHEIHDLARQYRIAATITADGKAKVSWKLLQD